MARSPSDADIRAVLISLLRRAGGAVEITNAELYDAMIPDVGAGAGGFAVEEIPTGIRVILTADET